ncbi:hypothetical protein TeGR_g10894 [Tetraparma gracilis]|uniref:C-type lectin domain-containing protein n=1 Tax=Tetraparma gracilis TaxID=2962635 RepID=A0ABQ6MIW4_9STRA|nr:hypothetical protein TeGR_g10894 [Tetraparma gracilis]
MFVLLLVGDRLSIKKKKSGSDNLAAVTPVLDGTSPAPASKLADSLTFLGFFGLSGAFVAVALLGIGALAIFLGYRVETGPDIYYLTTQAVLFYLVGLLAIFYWFSFVMSWRALVNNLVDVHEGRVDPLAALDKIPVAKKLMKWYHDNLAIHTAGRYSILVVVSAEAFEFMVQTANANGLAMHLDWNFMELYANVIFANFLVFGICLLTPDRYIPSSALITIDVLIDATYIMFNITFVSVPESYWPIIVPLWFAVDMVNDSFTRQAQEQVNHHMIKLADEKQFEEAKANGTLPDELCAHFMAQLNSGEERGRLQASPPSGYSELKPRMWYEDSEDSNVATVVLSFVLLGVTPGQACTFSRRYTTEERGSGTMKIVQTFSKNHRTIHGKPARTASNAVVSRRDITADSVWKRLEAEDGTAVFVDVTRSCELADVPPEKGFIRADSYQGFRYEATTDGTRIDVLLRFDPCGSIPPSFVNFALKSQMKLRLESYKTYFIDRKAPDGSDNGGDWPDDERIYNFKVEGEDGGGVHILNTMTVKDLVASTTVSQAAGLAKPKFIATLRRVLGWSFLLFGACMLVYINTTAGRQGGLCEGEFGACVWGRIEPKLYFKNGLHSSATCGFGVDENPNEDTWELDVSGCGVEKFVGWKEPFADLQTLELGNNSLVELPTWLGDGKMKKLKEVRARGNVIEKGLKEVFGSWSGCDTAWASCAECEAGESSVTGRGDCVACPSGKYAGRAGSTTCTSCAAGRYSGMEGATAEAACLPCEAGSASAAGSGACGACSVGKYAAESECQSLGTDLPIVRSAEANKRLAAGAAKLGAYRIWLGASDEEKEGEWVWVDGTLVDFEGWASDQPDNRGSGQDFAALRTASAEWNDLSDYVEVEFLCEGDGIFSCPPSEQPDLVSGGCEPCPAGTESLLTDSDPCKLTSCAAGTYLDAAVGEGAECRPCPAGKFKDDDSASACTDCRAGTFNPAAASTTCTSCPATHPISKAASVAFSSCKVPANDTLTTTLELLDLRENNIARLPYEVMDVDSSGLTMLLDGNPGATEIDWSNLGVSRLPLRMGDGFGSMGWEGEVKTVKLGGNKLDESVFGQLVAAGFTNIEVLDIDAGQAMKLQDRNLTLHGNPVKSITWAYETELKKIPAWLRTLEAVTDANLEYCDVKEMQGGAFSASLEELKINNQAEGLRLHPDSFEGLPNLWHLDMSTNEITEDDMHPGLFAGASSLRDIVLYGNTGMRRFNATELFPGGSKTVKWLNLDMCGLKEGTSFQGLPYLKRLDLRFFSALPPRLFSGLCALRCETGKSSFPGSSSCSPGCSWSIFIDGSDVSEKINLAEVQAFDLSRSLITPRGAEQFSTHSGIWGLHRAENCIDGNTDNFCHSGGDGAEEYLRVDYFGPLDLASIVVTNRPNQFQERIVGARIHVTTGWPTSNNMAAESALWSGNFTSASSDFTFSPETLDCL